MMSQDDIIPNHDGYESLDDSINFAQSSRQTIRDEESLLYNKAGSMSSLPPQPDSASRYGSHFSGIQASGSGMSTSTSSHQPVLEIPEEVYTVRKAALTVLKPLTRTWIVVSVGFALTILFGMSKWTRLLPGLPFWFILLPAWTSHAGLLWLHVLAAKALSAFIAEANENRQRSDSRDHLNRTEYLPLLQRSLKYGLKTGLLSFCLFLFEILIYIRLTRRSISLTGALFPLWILLTGGIVNGIICKTQDLLRILCWFLAFSSVVLTILKVDYGDDSIRWRLVLIPIIAFLAIVSASLLYIIYGHQIGYYRLTESQLTAGNLYSLAALICIVLIVMIGEVIPLNRPVEVETRLFVVILAPLVVCLVGMGAWVVSRDEFARLLLFGGQAAVHPMKLRWESKGWTTVQGKGVVAVPMFGEVNFQPLDYKHIELQESNIFSRLAVKLYPHEDVTEEEDAVFISGDLRNHPYMEAG
ncbi:hypothetical protein FisN_19Lh205 [Fistulifera solaris]|uniref:Uncharacterized protein n=1 Tax=Fistulifera solaris TaxID=1519565 RepID=A0A1Z5J6V8_FISSO|nr:hypothetical protein FisN_19Lh205 [Fistulifera solaris]|eukprot:GAX09735.1 hypothetical protein FisN_19Lh205 [Fistulifera solaris]